MKITMTIRKMAAPRNLLFVLFSGAMLLILYHPFQELAGLVFASELYSHLLFIALSAST
jgi:hypothetical protein